MPSKNITRVTVTRMFEVEYDQMVSIELEGQFGPPLAASLLEDLHSAAIRLYDTEGDKFQLGLVEEDDDGQPKHWWTAEVGPWKEVYGPVNVLVREVEH